MDTSSALPTATKLTNPNSVSIGASIDWIAGGWNTFKADWGVWLLIILAIYVGLVVLSLLSYVGYIIITLITPVIIGGLLLGVHASATQNKPLTFSALGLGFKEKFINLIVLGAITTGAGYLLSLIPEMIAGDFLKVTVVERLEHIEINNSKLIIYMLLSWVTGVILTLLFFFTTPLMVFNNITILEAIKASFTASLKNILPLVVYSVLTTILILIGIIPVGLGLLIIMPILLISFYYSYKDVFTGTTVKEF